MCKADRRFSSAYQHIINVSKQAASTWTYCSIIFFEKFNYSNVVFESDDMGLGKDTQVGHVRGSSRYSTKDVFAETDGIQLEVGLELKVGHVVKTPFS